jgi:hypothetical protein
MRKTVAGAMRSLARVDAYLEFWSTHYLNADHLRDLRLVLSEPYWGSSRTLARTRR